MSAEVGIPVPKFVLVKIENIEPAAPVLIIGESVFTKARSRGIDERDVALVIAAELTGEIEAVQMTDLGDTLAVASGRVGGYVAGDLHRDGAGRIVAAVVYRVEHAELVEAGGPRYLGRALTVDAAARVAEKRRDLQ